MKYIPINDFEKHYPFSKIIFKGDGRRIYDGKDYVVKEVDNIHDFLREVNYYCSFNHPFIMNIDTISYINKSYTNIDRKTKYKDQTSFLIKMKKGKDTIQAITDGNISLQELTFDILNALSYLHERGIGHFDIKDENIIIHEGKAKLIDFGFSNRCKPYDYHHKKDFFCDDIAGFTDTHVDPQFYPLEMDSIKSDIYSFGVILYDLYMIKYNNAETPWDDRKGLPYPDLNSIKDKKLKDFISECFKPWNLRKSSKELLNHSYIQSNKYHSIDIKDKYIPWIHSENRYKNCDKFNQIMIDVCKQMDKYNIDTKNAFDIIHDIQICLGIINPSYDREFSRNICDKIIFLVDSISKESKSPIPFDNDFELLFEILDVLDGQITHLTYYSFSPDVKFYPILFEDTLRCNYNPNYMRDLNNITMINQSQTGQLNYEKFRTIYDLIKDNIKFLKPFEEIPNSISVYNFNKFPSILIKDYERYIKILINSKKKYEFEGDENFTVIMNYMELLPKINKNLYFEFENYMNQTERRRQILSMIEKSIEYIK